MGRATRWVSTPQSAINAEIADALDDHDVRIEDAQRSIVRSLWWIIGVLVIVIGALIAAALAVRS